MSEGSGAEREIFKCTAGAALGIAILPVGADGDSLEARKPCTGRGSWVDGTANGIGGGWRVVWLGG